MTRQYFVHKATALFLLLFFASGCAMFGKKKGTDEPVGISQDDATVVQGGNVTPVFSGHDRKFWLDMRANSKDTVKRMYAALATGESGSAAQLAKGYLKKRPGNVDALSVLALSHAMNKKSALAAFYAKQVEKQQPDSALAANLKGLATMLAPRTRIKDFHKAIHYFHKAQDNSDIEIAASLNLGHLYLELGNANSATGAFKQAADRCSQCTRAMMGYGVSLSRERRFKEAKEAFANVLGKRPGHPKALFRMALVYRNGFHQNRTAAAYLHRVINTRSKDVFLIEKAHSVLRDINSEKVRDKRGAAAKGGDAEDLMDSNEFKTDDL